MGGNTRDLGLEASLMRYGIKGGFRSLSREEGDPHVIPPPLTEKVPVLLNSSDVNFIENSFAENSSMISNFIVIIIVFIYIFNTL